MAVTIAAGPFGVVAAPALAQNSESAPAAAALMKSKPKTPAGGTVTVKVTNWREADLVELQVVESGSANWKKVLGALKAGQWTWAKVPQGKNCHVDLRGKYADGKSADVSNVDVCADKTVDLVTDAPEASGARNLGSCFIGGLPHCFYRRAARRLPRGRAPAARAISSARLNSASRRRPQLPQRRVQIAAGSDREMNFGVTRLQTPRHQEWQGIPARRGSQLP